MVRKPLIVYKASAGSGKTFTLATEYIKLVVQDPSCYRNILAVTFTNKATEEMKMRILSQLYGIREQLPDSDSYTQRICQELDASPAFVARQAGIALSNLLHNYNYFRVQTIDTFFQSVLRNLARELELTPNLRIGLNDIQIEELAVDQMIEDLTTKDVLLKWILKYIMENIEDAHSWNVISKIKSFGKTIFKEFYKQNSEILNKKLQKKAFFDDYTSGLRKIRDEAKERMKSFGDSFFDIMKSEGLEPEELAGRKNSIASFFRKLQAGNFDESIRNATVEKCLADPANWYTKTSSKKEQIHSLAEGPLGNLLHQAVEERPRQWKLYKSADLTLRHLNQLRLLGSIERKVNELNESSNHFLLSNTQELLRSLIQDSDSPFIYEKIGSQLSHVMIDEFQDTSVFQWKNFKVLLQESMSHDEAENLIVGDVKQSIYRWRSGDWRLLNDIEHEFPFPEKQLDIRPLATNYRSERRIVQFNNAFFQTAVALEQENLGEPETTESEQLRKAYADVVQQVPAGRPDSGCVDICLLPSEDYQENVLQQTAERVTELLSKGVPPGDIACLLRTNKQISLLADFFTSQHPDIRIVSEEAFRLDASPAVNILCNALLLLTHPDHQLARAFLVKNMDHRADITLNNNDIEGALPEEFRNHREQLLQQPLHDLTETLIRLFRLHEMPGQGAYLCTFMDELDAYLSEHVGDIDEFLQEWNDNLYKKTIQSEELDGIRLLSIHKSKGLEFPHVIIPFCDWQLEMYSGTVIWCQPQESPFNQLPLIPIDYSQKQLKGTVYEKDYHHEHLQNVVDNLNLLYVAFTRASSTLTVIGRRKASNSRSQLVEHTLPRIVTLLEGSSVEGDTNELAPLTFHYGDFPQTYSKKSEPTASSNVFSQTTTSYGIRMEQFNNKMEFRQSNKSRDFIHAEEEPEADEKQRDSYIKTGNVLHNIFSQIRTTADIDTALQELQQEGILYDDTITPERLTRLIRKRLSDPRIAEWFSDKWEILNECTILHVDPATDSVVERRPDRVMKKGDEVVVVDFKFGHARDEYLQQVREYIALLRQMGHTNVKGFLWYVYSNQIVEVK